jgi:hypothetical protein
MQYALLIYGDEEVYDARDERERQENHKRRAKFMAMLRSRNLGRSGEELSRSATATTVRNSGDQMGVTNGPYAETAEQLAGFYPVEAADPDEALEPAGCPSRSSRCGPWSSTRRWAAERGVGRRAGVPR